MGNRRETALNAHSADWMANALNQYGSREVPRMHPVWGQVGTAHALEVDIDGIPVAVEQGQFYAEASVGHANAWYETIAVTAALSGGQAHEQVGYAAEGFVAANPEAFTHDADGNLTEDGRWAYGWNAENRLVTMETTVGAAAAGVPRQRLEFGYDSVGRRYEKRVYAWDGNHYELASTRRFVYDDWNLIAEMDETGTIRQRYTWGLDLSGSLQGAGLPYARRWGRYPLHPATLRP